MISLPAVPFFQMSRSMTRRMRAALSGLLAVLAVAIVGSFGVHWVFESLLRVPLPYASLPFLQTLGL